MATIHISNDLSGCIIVSFPSAPLLVAKVKSISGRRWHPTEKHWSFSNLDGMLERILKVFGDEDFQINPGLQPDIPKTSSSDYEVNQEQSKFDDLSYGTRWG